jgi:hypothetical protein
MKYFGKKSLSSFMSGFLRVCWGVVLVLAILAPLAAGVIIFFSTPAGENIILSAQNGTLTNCNQLQTNAAPGHTKFDSGMSDKDRKDWESFKNLPIAVKILILPYCEAVLILLMIIIKTSRSLFANFKNDIVFNKSNAQIISKISKLNIGFSILTFSFSSLLVSLFLFMLCEIFKNGTALQEEHDLTV